MDLAALGVELKSNGVRRLSYDWQEGMEGREAARFTAGERRGIRKYD